MSKIKSLPLYPIPWPLLNTIVPFSVLCGPARVRVENFFWREPGGAVGGILRRMWAGTRVLLAALVVFEPSPHLHSVVLHAAGYF